MKFQDSSFNGLKVTVGTKSVTHAPTHARTHARSKSNMPHQLFQSLGHKLSRGGDGSGDGVRSEEGKVNVIMNQELKFWWKCKQKSGVRLGGVRVEEKL